jgi:hypothetical protein
MSDDRQDLTGVWYGRDDASGYDETNGFIAQIEEHAGALSGIITEPDTTGQTGVRRAFVSGMRTCGVMEFVKQYDGGAMAHAVRYFGEINRDATEITGGWVIVQHGGTFVMEREKFSVEELEEEEIDVIDRSIR